MHIEAVSVNHNTSAYMELMIRSLFARNQRRPSFALTICDNDSVDDLADLRRYAESVGVPIIPSGFPIATQHNSHGEVLRRFVLEHSHCSHYLFLDADVCFVEEDVIAQLLSELEQQPDAFGIGPRMSWDGIAEIPSELRQANPDICDARLHPACALMRNTPLFQELAGAVGFSAISYLWADRAEYRDTMKLFTQAMRACGQRHIVGKPLIQHFFAVSYPWDDQATTQHKARMRDLQLRQLRAQ
ncbi:hypothetical protein F8S13_00295 [Chloroflexia bacterium SDU3-3]|nr:hypothetical protein F8S13_00295 [Chloroflexia bacterium SDU3-3]